MSREFWQNAVETVSRWGHDTLDSVSGTSESEVITPTDPVVDPDGPDAVSATEQAGAAIETAEVQEVAEVCQDCSDKWLVITIERHTKHNFSGRWDCTVGDLKMEIWDAEDSGSGGLVFECTTSERGGPADANFHGDTNSSRGSNYSLYNQYIIMPSENYGISAHRSGSGKYYTYNYNVNFLDRPRPGIAIYGTGSGSMDRRGGVLIHAGTNHRWSVGCIVLHTDGEVRDGAYRFDQTSSVNTLLTFFRKIHEFTGVSRHPVGQKMRRVRLIIRENF